MLVPPSHFNPFPSGKSNVSDLHLFFHESFRIFVRKICWLWVCKIWVPPIHIVLLSPMFYVFNYVILVYLTIDLIKSVCPFQGLAKTGCPPKASASPSNYFWMVHWCIILLKKTFSPFYGENLTFHKWRSSDPAEKDRCYTVKIIDRLITALFQVAPPQWHQNGTT